MILEIRHRLTANMWWDVRELQCDLITCLYYQAVKRRDFGCLTMSHLFAYILTNVDFSPECHPGRLIIVNDNLLIMTTPTSSIQSISRNRMGARTKDTRPKSTQTYYTPTKYTRTKDTGQNICLSGYLLSNIFCLVCIVRIYFSVYFVLAYFVPSELNDNKSVTYA